MQYRIMNVRPDGTLTVRIRYWENGVLKTVPADSVPRFKSEAELQNYMPILEARFDSQKQERLRREAWHDRYYNFVGLKEAYQDYAKEKAPRTWRAKMSYLENYVFHFFLNEKRLDNLDLWFPHFMEFRQWLKNCESFSDKEKKLMPNTINHCIVELNIFLEFMAKLGNCRMQPKCETFANAKEDSRKGLDSVFGEQEAEDIYEFLQQKNPKLADAFWLLLKTGMRISEFRGIGPANIKIGEIPQKSLHKLIIDTGLPSYKCFIFFNSQVETKNMSRENGRIKFIPLKSKKKISAEYTRYVPIFDIRAYQIIKKLMPTTQELFKAQVFGPDIQQYAFFYDEINQTALNFALAEFYQIHKKIKPKTTHDTRHSYATWVSGLDITGTLQEYILGHQEQSARRYNHLKEQLLEASKLKGSELFKGWED